MKIEIIPTKGWLYDKCENMEQLYDKYYYPLLVENKELKSQLKGTTHCYDETEHRQLKQENAELKKQLEVGEQQYNDLVEEKEKLEEQLSSITLQLKDYKNQVNKGLYNTCLPYKTGYDKAFAEKNESADFYRCYDDYGSYWLPFDLDDYVEII